MAVGTTNYPTSLDTVVELVEAANNAADTLSAGISAGDASLTLTDAAEFAASGIVAIENELLSYTGKSGSTLTGLTRGIEGTTAASHSSGADVRQVITAASHNVQSAAIIALEQKLGTGTDIAWSQMSPLTANRLVVTDGAGDVTASPLTHDATNAVIGNIGGLDFDTTPTATPTTARMVWDDTHGTVNLTLKGGTVGVDIGQTTVARVVNKTVTNINLLRSNYQVVRIVSAQGQRLAISLAQGNSEPNSTDVIGLVAEDIANNQEGFIVVRGLITEINTTGSLQGETWADGDILYLSPTTAGGLTKVEPQAPDHLIIVGYVVYAHSQHGKIYVAIQTSWETKELHDVKITGTPVAGSLLIRNATTGVWENATLTAGSNITITNADKSITIAGTGGVASVTGTSPVVSSGGSTPAISLASGYGDTQNPYASKTANHFLAAPNGTAGAPTFRAIVAADIPTLNQNTTGTASNVTGTVAIANGGTGATTAGAALTNLGATTVGGNLFTLTNPSAVTFPRFNADNTVSALTDTAFRTAIGAGTVTGVTASSPLSSSGGATPNLSLGTVPVANGGTGLTSVSTGQLLIGTSSGSFAASTLTAGSNVTITSGSGTVTIAASSGAAGGQFVVKNTSGATANANDVGYIDSAGEYKTTTTEAFGGAWCVVVTGAANGSNITVARRGKVTVTLSANCSIGDRLVTSTTAGRARPLGYDHYNLFAVALTANSSGAGGTCEALLYTGTNFQTTPSDEFLFRGTPCDVTNFRATIKSLTSTSVTFNTPLSGTFNAMSLAKAIHGTQLTYMLLYNETRGTFRKITLHTDGSDTVTVLSATDSWAVNDTCTIASQTTVVTATNRYVTMEFKDAVTVPALSRAVQFIWLGASSVSTVLQVHPHETLGGGKIQPFYVLPDPSGAEYMTGFPIVALVDRKISVRIQNAGGATNNHSAYLGGVFLAVP